MKKDSKACATNFKRIFHPTNENLLTVYSPLNHPRCRWVVSSSQQFWRNRALNHLFINASSAVNGCRQNESPNSWLKHHNNPHHSSLSVNILRSEKLCVCKKQIYNYGVFNCKPALLAKIWVHNPYNTSSSEHSSLLSSHFNMHIHICWTVFVINSAYFSPDSAEMTFSLRKQHYILWTRI